MKNSRLLISLMLLLCTTVANGMEVSDSYTAKFIVDGNEYASYTLSEGDALEMPAPPSKPGYAFVGWVTSDELNELPLASNADAMLYSNATCKTEEWGDQFTSWNVLFDNDPATIFHSDYSKTESEDGLEHYIRVDMGEGNEVSTFTFTYRNRNKNSDVNAPKTIIVEGSDQSTGKYTQIARLTNLSSTNSYIYESESLLGNGENYRYIRYRVTETQQNQLNVEHPFFFISEFGMDVSPALPKTMPANDITLRAIFKEHDCDIDADGILYDIIDEERKNVKVIGKHYGANYSGTIKIPASVEHNGTTYNVTEIAASAFYDCTWLTTIKVPNSITAIADNAFTNCLNLKTIINLSGLTFEEGTTSHGNIAYYAEEIINYDEEVGDYRFDIVNGIFTLTDYVGNDTELALPETYYGEEYAVADGAFSGNTTMTSITIPSSVTSIGNEAFNGCTSLAELRIEDGEKTLTLGYNTYNETEDGKGLFADCPLQTLYLGRDLEYSEEQCHGYSPLMGKETLTDVTIGEYVTYIRSSLICFSTNLTSLVIPGNVKSIGNHAFGACYNLTDLTIGEGVETLGKDIFNSCTSLESVTIPASVTSIGEGAFIYCLKLAKITSLATTPATVGINAFKNIASGATLYVHKECKSAYRQSSNWPTRISGFASNIIYKVNGSIYKTVEVEHGAAITPITAPEQAGCNFIEWEGMPEYMPENDIEVNGIYEVYAVVISISQYGSATYSSQYALDFSEVEGLKAYAATGYNTVSGEITMTRVKSTNAGVGIYLAGEPNTTYLVPLIDHSNNHSLNLLVGTLKKTMVNTYSDDGSYVNYRYGVATGETNPKFFRYSDNSTCSAGKAYLQIPAAWIENSAAKAIGLRFEDDEIIGDDEVTDANVDETIVYDLNGRRIADVDNLERGIYIINGKKVLVK